jgi:hypothetical protein
MREVRAICLPRRASAVLGPAPSAAVAWAGAPEQPSEPFFPRSGNRGYDVQHYDVSLGYQPRSRQLNVRDAIEAKRPGSRGARAR